MSNEVESAQIPADRQRIIDELTRRQHAQANEITSETGQRYITSPRAHEQAEADGVALRRETEFWRQHGRDHRRESP